MKYLFTISLCILSVVISHAQTDMAQLIAALLADTPIEEDLQELCDGIGGRVTGSEANERSVEWAYSKFEEAGVRAWKDPFEMPVLWLPGSTVMRITGTTDFQPNVVAKYQSPPGTYRGRLIAVGRGGEADFEAVGADDLRGAYVLVETDLCLDIAGLFAEYQHAVSVEDLGRRYEVGGIVFMASRPRGLLYRFITSKGADNTLPQFIMAREDAKRCLRTLEKGALEVEVDLTAKVGGAFKSHNVIAEIPGRVYPEEVVIVGAHLDSWALGTGANDNGCNVSLLIDMARQMKRLGIQGKRTIRFALWNGEEQGYFGSWDYTKDHRHTLDKHIMAMSVDIGSGPIIGFFTNGRSELLPVLDTVLQPVAALGNYLNINVPIVGTDNFDFMLEGVGNLVANHKPALYGPNYHAASDTYDKVDLKALKINSAIVAAVVLGFANADPAIISWSRQSREEIQALFDTHKLEFTMRMFNVWEPWVRGERGRQ